MNLEELRSVQRTERQKDSLQHLRDSFYRDAADYVAELKAERDRVAAEVDDPFSSPEVGRITDEIETAEEVVESLYERRVGKVVKRATFAAADMAAEEEGLTSEERELFDDLVARIKENRESVLDTLAGNYAEDAAASTPDATTSPDAASDSISDAVDDAPPVPDSASPDAPTEEPADGGLLADAMGDAEATDAHADGGRTSAGATGTASEAGANAEATTDAGANAGTPDAEATTDVEATTDADRTTVRITRDVGEIFGVDEREYELASEDVVSLPTTNAEPLIDREAAEPLE
ncbi:hypothetical protein ACFQJD_13815 [Haloplanus sp. GCM10025708]|uniref:hypothetical protein n=1 Tax=Haloferacaceae TaxID=1644056 RepID=UPI00360E97F0